MARVKPPRRSPILRPFWVTKPWGTSPDCEDFGSHEKTFRLSNVFLWELRLDVVNVARKNETPIGRVAKGFGISDSWLQRWSKRVVVEDGNHGAQARWADDDISFSSQHTRLSKRIPPGHVHLLSPVGFDKGCISQTPVNV